MIGFLKLDKEFFSVPANLSPNFSAGNVQVQHGAGVYTIESLATLDRLLAEKRQQKEDPVLRFLVDRSGIAWFARETRPGNHAPKHYQMTGESLSNASCITAGNIKFTNSSCTKLKNITHRSGDFHPSFHSLRLFLAILIINEKTLPFKLPRILAVKEYDQHGELLRKHFWPLAQIKKWVQRFKHQEELIKQLQKQTNERKIVHYEAVHFVKKPELNPVTPMPLVKKKRFPILKKLLAK